MKMNKHNPDYLQHKADKAAKRELAAQEHDKAVFGLTFQGFPKIDGTNAAIGIIETPMTEEGVLFTWHIYAQSRTRLLSQYDDNMGFAAWVLQYSEVLYRTLGPGLHYGEWWGQGIQRGYGLTEKRFSLFNVEKWEREVPGAQALADARAAGCSIYCVPVLYRGLWHICSTTGNSVYAPDHMLDKLEESGSRAAPGFMKPEGIVIYHKASGTLLKATLEDDEKPKGSTEVS